MEFGLRRVLIGALLTAPPAPSDDIRPRRGTSSCSGAWLPLGTGSMATVLAATVANRWFVQRRPW